MGFSGYLDEKIIFKFPLEVFSKLDKL